jgi:GT2 family glycosyltransferase
VSVVKASAPFSPMEVLSVDIGDQHGLRDLTAALLAGSCDRVLLLVRMCGEPLATTTISRREILEQPDSLLPAVGAEMRTAEERHGHAVFESGDSCKWRKRSRDLDRHAEPVSLVICTSGRPDRLHVTLESVAALRHPEFELVLVDNAPTDETNKRILGSFEHKLNAKYVIEPIRGLSRARNAGIKAAGHEIIAFTDDDVLLDADWLLALQRGFRLGSKIGAVSGPVLAAEVQTEAQDLFERNGGHSKERGFGRFVFGSPDCAQSPYFPLPPFGTGVSMAFRREVLTEIGGFDPALGAGTPSRAGEDTAAFTELILHGWTCAYEPSAVLWHFHRRTLTDLRTQRRGYGVGLGAFYAALLARDPRRLWPLMRLSPSVLRAVAGAPQRAAAAGEGSEPFRWSVDRRALLLGPPAYLRTRLSGPRPAAQR